MPSNDRRKEILDQPCAFKLVYSPEKGVNGHVIVQGPDAWHLFHGTCCLPDHAKYHATSKDLLTWTVHEPILTSGAPGSPDHNQLGDCTVIEHEGRWFMLYQAQPRKGAARRICLAVSEDLWAWRKVPEDGSPVFTPDPEWSGWCEDAGPRYCTSPTVLRHDGGFILHYCCYNRKGDDCIAAATSTDLVHWEDHGPIITVPNIHDDLVGPGGFEVPRVVERDGKFYLFVLAFWGWQYAIGEDPFHFGPFRVMGPYHAATIFQDNRKGEDEQRWYISHSQINVGKAGLRGAKRPPFRGLYLAGMVWAGQYPFVTDLQDVLEGWPGERGE